MRFQNVCLEAVAYELPPNIVTSEAIEARLTPVYGNSTLLSPRRPCGIIR